MIQILNQNQNILQIVTITIINSNKHSLHIKMGAKGSKIESQQINNFPKNLLIQLAFPKISQRFQKAQFFYKTKQMKIHLPVDNQSVLKKWQEDIKMVEDEQMKKYLLLPKQYIFNKQGFCGSSGVAQILYDYFPYSLEGQIQNRKKSIDNQEFSEPELWKILFTLLKSSHSMHANWKKVGDIRPKNIFYNEDKDLRVSCQCSYPRELTNYEKFIFQRQATYLSPQQIQDIKMGRIQQEKSRNSKQHIIQSESWSIGLTLLNVSLLFNFQKIYDIQKYEINLELVRQKLSDLEQNIKLSLAIKNIIKGMLEQFPERRLLCSQLLNNHLMPYAQDILNLKPFETRKLNSNITELMQKKAANSLIGTIWSACKTGFIQSLVINNVKHNQSQSRAKEALNEELQKFSQIPPKNSQVSMRDSIRLGGLAGSRGKASNFNESFHTVKSKQSYTLANKISNYSLENRFGGNRIPTAGQHVSPQKSSRYQINSDKFMTPLNTSNFQTIHGNQRSFDSSNFGQISSRFQTSQAIELPIKDQSQTVRMQGNFKKEKGKTKK